MEQEKLPEEKLYEELSKLDQKSRLKRIAHILSNQDAFLQVLMQHCPGAELELLRGMFNKQYSIALLKK